MVREYDILQLNLINAAAISTGTYFKLLYLEISGDLEILK